MLLTYGTRAFRLKPNSILQAARQDLLTKARKAQDSEEWVKPYAFCRKHVKKAKSVPDLLKAAMADLDRGLASSKYNTRLIYSDPDLLREAYEIAAAEEAEAA